ncbi:MAG: HD domain-containing protein [Sulfurimonas sp.]
MILSLHPSIEHVLERLNEYGIKAIIVGGYVRDALLCLNTTDIDIELYGVTSIDQLEKILRKFGKVNLVGKSFGVLKLSYAGYNLDFSPPRIESKRGFGHKGFEIQWKNDLDFTTAARRRDFTINAIGYDPQLRTFLDPYGGIKDLEAKRLCYVDKTTFGDDPLRVLRAVQFAARYELSCDTNLVILCREMIANGALEELPKERIFEEIKKLLLLSPKPSLGFELLKEMGGLVFFKELLPLETTPQDSFSHPEGNVWIHTLMALDTMANEKTGEPKRDLILLLAVLVHDIGKPCTTILHDGILNAPKHAEEGVEIARTFLERFCTEKELIERILPLVRYHGTVRKLFQTNANASAIRHLSTHVILDDLIRVAQADFYGRAFDGGKPTCFEAGEWLFNCSNTLGVLHAPPPPILLGRDLIALGLSPSRAFKTLLEDAYTAQLEGVFTTHEEAMQWISNTSLHQL